MTQDPRPDFLLWRPSPVAELGRYALAAAIVLALASGAVLWIGSQPEGQTASETDDAVLLDLPPALASAAPQRDVAKGSEQQASEAVAAVAPQPPPPPPPPPSLVAPPQAKPDETSPPPPPDTPPEEPKPPVEQKSEAPPPPQPPEVPEPPPPPPPPIIPPPPPDVEKTRSKVVETQPEAALPPPPVAAAPAQEETAPTGSEAPAKEDEPVESEASRSRAAHAISRWQRVMLGRLQSATGGTTSGGLVGTVEIAFSIDLRGHLRSSRVARSSGSERLDQAALALLKRAAPFPDPPAGLSDKALTFTVPIVFAHGR